jgi:hypothetical protein
MIKDGGFRCHADAATNSNNSRVRPSQVVEKPYSRLCTGNPQGSYRLWTKAAILLKHKEWAKSLDHLIVHG